MYMGVENVVFNKSRTDQVKKDTEKRRIDANIYGLYNKLKKTTLSTPIIKKGGQSL